MKLKLLLAFCFLLAVGSSAQWLGVVGSKPPVTTASVTVYVGGTGGAPTWSSYDSGGNGGYVFYTPITTPSVAFTLNNLYLYAHTAASGTWGTAIYTDNGGSPAGGTKVCGTTTTSAASNGYNALLPTGCSLSTSTLYWLAQYTSNDSWQEGYTSCTGSLKTFYSASTVTPWPTTAAAVDIASVGDCYTMFLSVTYTTSATYTVIQSGAVEATTEPNVAAIMPVQAGDTLIVGTVAYTSANPAVSVTDAISGSLTDTLTKRGTCPGVGGGYQVCFYSINTATTGVNSITGTFTEGAGDWHNSILYAEIKGTASSNSYDTSAYDTAYQTSSATFTSVNGITTSAPTELLVGLVVNATDGSAYVDYFTPGTGWSVLSDITNPAFGASFTSALLLKPVTTTGTYYASGTYHGAPADYLLPGIAGFK